jgi:hypothetical protein
MLRNFASAFVALVAAAILPAAAHAYGAAHTGYTHVGPSGVYHTGETVAHGPGGATYAHSSTGAYGAGGNAYHSESGGAAYRGESGGAAYGHSSTEYHYAPSYSGSASGGAAYHSNSYGYVR